MNIIDAHQHFWLLSRGDYDWITEDLGILNQDYLPSDLEHTTQTLNIQKTIAVQATDSIAESVYLLELANNSSSIAGVVGWVDFESPQCLSQLDTLAQNPKLVGIRPMIQSLEDDKWMLTDKIMPAIEHMIQLGLTFDALVLPKHLPYLAPFIAKYPKLKIIIDHGAKPNIAKGVDANHKNNWFSNIEKLAEHKTLYCKLSGLLTEANDAAQYDDLLPYMQHLLNCFGSQRLVFGSDWPVLNLNGHYAQWVSYVKSFIQPLSSEQQEDILYNNALKFYNISL